MPKTVTLRQVAREAGVHEVTAYWALSDDPSRVSPLTRRRIRAAARKLKYKPRDRNAPTFSSMARELGISHTAVRMAFQSGSRIGPQRRAEVLAHAKKIGFKP